jgi:cyanophycinase
MCGMPSRLVRSLVRSLVAVLLLAAPVHAQSPGAIVAVGGGGTTETIVQRTLALAGGRDAVVVVLPQSSAAASLIWIPGGDQNRFMKAITGTGLDDVIRARHRAGVVVGGTSAGAAVLSALMITGEADLHSLGAGTTVLGKGLGLWSGGIFDQHFLQRQRNNRLLSAVLDHPELIGVGIDEATAVILRDGHLEVVGRSAVVVYDPRAAKVEKGAAGSPVAATGIATSVLRAGMTLSIRPPR